MSHIGGVGHYYERLDINLESERMPAEAKKKLKYRLEEGRIAENHQACYDRATAALQQFPRDPDLYLFRATASACLKDPQKALEDLNHAIELRPSKETLGNIYAMMGTCYGLLGDDNTAADFHEKAARLGNNYSFGILTTIGKWIDPNTPSEKK